MSYSLTKLARLFVNQRDGDPDRRNGNCGFASALMGLRFLGRNDPKPAAIQGGEDYRKAMALRKMGGGGTNDAWSYESHVRSALDEMGANARFLGGNYGNRTEVPVRQIRAELADEDRREVFILLGNPSESWPRLTATRNDHFVAVVGYDEDRDLFAVLDPESRGPIEVSARQLATFLRDDSTGARKEVIRVTRPDDS
jgi:hypothetical protein